MKNRFFRCALLFLLLVSLSSVSLADLSITVKYDKRWGDAPTSNIKELCKNVTLHFQEQLRGENKIDGKLTIVYRSAGPIAFYRSYFGGKDNEYKIGLQVTDTYWAQFSYQFGHEFTHVFQRHDKFNNGQENKNGWFHEALCEVATLWVIYEMGETWAQRAPYPNWVGWRHNLTGYADGLKNRPEVQYNKSGAQWIKENENSVRNSHNVDYAFVSQLSYKFLPVFEEDPKAWNAVAQLPISNSKMSEYVREWHDNVDSQDQKYVKKIAEIMGITINDEALIASTTTDFDADVNNDGYVDLSDVLIVRSGMRNSVSYDTDINNDGRTDEIDLAIVKLKAVEAIVAAAPKKRKIRLTTWGQMKSR